MRDEARQAVERLVKSRVVENHDRYLAAPSRRRALLSYLVHPLFLPRFLLDPAQFSNQGMAREVPRVLNEMGYVVDIIDYGNTDWRPRHPYDLFVGHANRNFCRLASQLGRSATVVYFATGAHWRQQNTEVARRLYDVACRRGVLLPPERVSQPEEEDAYGRADGIICLGNEHAAKSFGAYPRVANVNNAAYPVSNVRLDQKDFAAGQRHFLFFSGLGNVHKGLDLLLEAFAGGNLHLHICQHIQPEFARAYATELSGHPNIHVHGFVKMRTPAFARLAQQCNWVILPTCAEGQPGSVIECMAYGLVPVLPDAANIDIAGFGYRIERLEVDHIRQLCETASRCEPSDSRSRAEKAAATVRERYSVECFRDRFQVALKALLDGE